MTRERDSYAVTEEGRMRTERRDIKKMHEGGGVQFKADGAGDTVWQEKGRIGYG